MVTMRRGKPNSVASVAILKDLRNSAQRLLAFTQAS
jgi:hypothetical protein